MTTRHDPAFPYVFPYEGHGHYSGLTKLEYAAIQISASRNINDAYSVTLANLLFDVLEAE